MSEPSILMIGCGGLGKCLLELNLICNFIPPKYKNRNMRHITIIEPQKLEKKKYSFFRKYKIHHIKQSLNKTNIKSILSKHIPGKVIVLDVSIGVNAIDVMKVCHKYNVMYVNTSLENWDVEEPEKLNRDQDLLYPRTLHCQYTKLMKIKKFRERNSPTMVFDHGMNPGLISHLAKKAIQDCFNYKFHKKLSFTKKSLAEGAVKIKLETIHVAEYDTQTLSIKFNKNTFYNTWSGHGMIAEGIDPIQIGHSKTKSKIDTLLGKGYVPKIGVKNIRYYPFRGVEKKVNTIIITEELKEKIIKGYLIPHGEANTLSRYLSTKTFTPNVYYVYHPSEPTMRSLENLEKRNYIAQPHIHNVLEQSELGEHGYDSIGAHLILKENYGWWTGTILSLDNVRDLGMRYAGPTETQVAISYLACVKWMLEHSKKGLCSPEDLPSLQILKWCKPYLGKFISKRISKHPHIF